MNSLTHAVMVLGAVVGTLATDIVLENFASPTHTWKQQNDPVMGGRSTGTFAIQGGVGVFDGEVVDVPSLQAPGFIKVSSSSFFRSGKFTDVSMCSALTITAKASTDFKGYRVSFGNAHPAGGKFFAFGYKANFAPIVGDFGTVSIKFSDFSDLWDDATGEQIKTCKSDPQYCPDEAALKNLKTVSIWAEGIAGKVHLEIKSIGATGCASASLTELSGGNVVLEDFGSPNQTWKQLNDPVMGGRSTGTFTLSGEVGVFDGEVVDVPFLKAPGFIKVESSMGSSGIAYRDVSMCSALTITSKASSDYKGFRVSFGDAHPAGARYHSFGYKANFAPSVGEFGTVSINFNDFSDLWDDATGDQIKTCKADPQYCPDTATLKDLKTISIWAEGVGGKVHLEIKSIGASGCGETATYDKTCTGRVQSTLRYNMSKTRSVEDFPFPLPQSESLVDAVCCDSNFKANAEPRFTFARDDVSLFTKMNQNGTTTFYDSVCGIPLFVAPRGRTLADFQADTTEHGWPSFRPAELVEGNSHVVKETGEVLSKCGTHLGSFLPDDRGDRWCLDLACVSGNPQ